MARGSQPLSRVLDPTAAALLACGLNPAWGSRLVYHAWPEAIWGEAGRVRALTLNDGRELPCQAVLFSIGVAPNVEFLAGTDLATAEGITVDHQMGTADPHIFAAGDCAHPYHLLTGKRAGYHIWPAAVAQGRVAGANLAGAGLTYDGLLPQNSLSLRGFHIITGGLGPQDAEGCETVSELDERRGHTAASSTGRGNSWASPWWARWKTRGFIFS